MYTLYFGHNRLDDIMMTLNARLSILMCVITFIAVFHSHCDDSLTGNSTSICEMCQCLDQKVDCSNFHLQDLSVLPGNIPNDTVKL